MYNRVAPKKWKFCDSGQMIGEVIMKWFYFYCFWFHQPYAPAMPKNQNQNALCAFAEFFFGAQSILIRNTAETYDIFFRGFFGWIKIWKMMEIHEKCCVIKFLKIPEKVFNYRWIGGWAKSKNEYFFELYITQAFFCPLSWIFTTTRSVLVRDNLLR